MRVLILIRKENSDYNKACVLWCYYIFQLWYQENIEKLMTIAKDFAVVNKKAGVDLEEALINLSEGIKLDLSRLMDASGLSKNLSNIYSDYANAINKDVSNFDFKPYVTNGQYTNFKTALFNSVSDGKDGVVILQYMGG